jgi:hypothetical protein
MDPKRIAELRRLIPDELVIQMSEAFEADPGFRRAFFSDPQGAYRRRFGKELLPGEEITIEESADGTRCLCLPRIDARFVLAATASDLSDAELAYAVGGAPPKPAQKSGFEKFCGGLVGHDKGAGAPQES